MKSNRSFMLLMLGFFTTVSMFAAQEPELGLAAEVAEPEKVEITTHEPAKKTTMTIKDIQNMMKKTETKINQVKDLVESDQLKTMAAALRKMKNSLHSMMFKNGPGFEVANKSEEPIWITVVSNDTVKTNQKTLGRDKIEPGDRFALDMNNLNDEIKIAVYLNDPWLVLYDAADNMFAPDPDYVYETTEGAQGKTKYFTWNPAKHNVASKYLYPQTGKLGGHAKVSSSKYSLSNNIKTHQLILTEK